MTKRFPLLDGRTVDLETAWPPSWFHPQRVYTHRFDSASNPWWLSLETANGAQSFAGLSSAAGLGTTSLTTGTTAVDDHTNLATPAVDLENWDELWFGAWNSNGAAINRDLSEAEVQLSWGDNANSDSMANGFYWQTQTGNQAVDLRVVNGGVSQYDSNHGAGREAQMFGLHVFRNPDNAVTTGHNVVAYSDWQPDEQLTDGEQSIPAGEHPFRIGIVTKDTAGDRTATFDTVVLALG